MNNIDMLHAVGHTPLVETFRFAAACGVDGHILAKCEFCNPGGSSKDRTAAALIADAEQQGLLLPEGTIIEPTSGNTGIGLALVAAQRGYRLILTMPESMSVERRKLLAALGAEVVLTPAALGMQGAVDQAMLLAARYPRSYIPNQFINPANAAAHYYTTGPEIWEQCGGELDAFIATVGTGGTVTGCGQYLKEQQPDITVIGVEPAESPLLSEGRSGPHGIQGIGANFIPGVLKQELLDRVITVYTDEAIATARRFAASEGAGCGISSGAALAAAVKLLAEPEWAGKTVAVVLPDGNNRYLSTALFD